MGVVEGRDKGAEASFASLRVKLTTNFSQLSTVRVITNNMSEQLHVLERADADSVAQANKDRKP